MKTFHIWFQIPRLLFRIPLKTDSMFLICNRVYDCLPLYDILNQFQKGHSHMAVVVKCSERATNKTSTFTVNNSNSRERQAKKKGKTG